MGKTALIFGISGQDGAWLAQLLLAKGYAVHGTSRDAEAGDFANLHALGLHAQVTLHSATPHDARSVLQTIAEVAPQEIYNLAGQSSVALSFEQPVETLESIAVGTLNILEAIRFLELPTRLYNAASGECFGNSNGMPASETTPFHPRSPYAVAKAASFWQVANYREAYGLFACSGLLFNHESPLRPARFVTRKIVQGACRIAAGLQQELRLGDLSIRRDWGWAPEYVEAMWRMLQLPQAEDFVIATGVAHSLQQFVEVAFAEVGLDWRAHVQSDAGLRRPSDIALSVGDPAKAARLLGWRAEVGLSGIVARMVAAERAALG